VLNIAALSLGDFSDNSTAQQRQHQSNDTPHYVKTTKEQVQKKHTEAHISLDSSQLHCAPRVFRASWYKTSLHGVILSVRQDHQFQVGAKVGLHGPFVVFGLTFL
jgi:hypothetical protein